MTFLRTLWAGGYPLPKAFWGAYVLGCIGVFALGVALLVGSYKLGLGTIGFIASFVLFNGYWFIAAVGVWVSARDYIAAPIWIDRLWGYVARGVVLLFVLRAVVWLINGGAHYLLERMTAPMDF